MATLTSVLALLALLAVAQSAPRVKRQAQFPQNQFPQNQFPQNQFQQGNSFNCPTSDGQFSYPPDCTRFYQCDGGVATVAECQPQLVFNAQAGYCDWPANVPNCPRPQNQQLVKSEIGNICANNPAPGGNPGETFHVGHHRYCNAFFTCSVGYLYGQCTFCPDGSYFNRFAGGCRVLPAGIINTDQLCEGKTLVDHRDKTDLTLGDDCWPFANIVNPWQALARQRRPQQQPGFNPGFNNPGFNNPGFNNPGFGK